MSEKQVEDAETDKGAVPEPRRTAVKGWELFANNARRIDHCRHAIIRRPDNPPPVLHGAHPNQLQMLFPRRGPEEIAVVRDIDENVGAFPRKVANVMPDG